VGPGETAIAILLAQLDGIVAAAPAHSDERCRDAVLLALLSALIDPALPLAAVAGCAQAVQVTLRLHTVPREELTAKAREIVRQATCRPLTARHPAVRRALATLQGRPRWREEGDLAQEVGTSRSHFARIVHQDTGVAYRTLRRLVVMKAAMIEVLTSGEQFAQIAYRLGMQPGSLDEIFRETFGCCPRELRRRWSRLPR
jgi:AraC-like DNA-binding protein